MSRIDDFNAMALDNSFGAESYYNVKSLPLAEYEPVASTKGITLCRHKNNGTYYVIAGSKAPAVFTDSPEQQRAFCRKTVAAYEAMGRGKVFYATAPVKVIFENIWR